MSPENNVPRPNTPKVRDDLIFRQLDEEWVVYDSEHEKLHVLNSTAALVWLHCNGDCTVKNITDAIEEAVGTDIPRNQLEQDVLNTIDEFGSKGLLE